MLLINGNKFSKIIRRYRCDDEVQKQIREFITTTMLPNEDIVLNHCIVTVQDRSKRTFLPPWQARYFDVGFNVKYIELDRDPLVILYLKLLLKLYVRCQGMSIKAE